MDNKLVMLVGGGQKLMVNKRTIKLKMADQGRSELHVVLTIILCGTNFLFGGLRTEIHKLSLNSFSEPVNIISKQYSLK